MAFFNTHLKTIIVTLLLAFPLSACSVSEEDVVDPIVGKTVELKSPLFVLSGLDKNHSFTDSPTAKTLGNVSLSLNFLTSCAGCNFRAMTLNKFLPINTELKVIKAYATVPPFIHLSSGMNYYVLETKDKVQFVTPVTELENAVIFHSAGNQDEEMLSQLITGFSNSKEIKLFYFQTKNFYQNSLFPGKTHSFTSDDVKNTFPEVFADIGKYNITDINTQSGQLSFSVKTDREGLAYLILKTSEKYVTISPLLKNSQITK